MVTPWEVPDASLITLVPVIPVFHHALNGAMFLLHLADSDKWE